MSADSPNVLWFEKVGRGGVAKVGGKNASLGEMVANLNGKGLRVPPSFATTADAYWRPSPRAKHSCRQPWRRRRGRPFRTKGR